MSEAIQHDDGATQFHRQKYKAYYDPGILDADAHWPLVEDLDRITSTANIPETFVYTRSMASYCDQEEVDWVKKLRQHRKAGKAGLMYTGTSKSVSDRMMAITGALLRNYIDARFYMVQDVIDQLRSGTMPSPTVALCPNFVTFGKESPEVDWKCSLLLSWLLKRYAEGKITILYAASYQKANNQWGSALAEELEAHYDAKALY